MMIEQAEVSCHLARDLFIPYLAGDVSPETRVWLEQHLQECADCRDALEGARAQLAAGAGDPDPGRPRPSRSAAPSDGPGRRLLSRVRQRNMAVAALLVLLMVAAVWAVVWGITSLSAWADMPLDQPVPAATVRPEEAVGVDLTPLGLRLQGITSVTNGAVARLQDAGGNPVRIELYRLATVSDARHAYEAFKRQYAVKIMSIAAERPSGCTTKFHSGNAYLYAWQTDTWFVVINVSKKVAEPATIRDGIRDSLFESFEQMNPASDGR